jgi:hypothetical protein
MVGAGIFSLLGAAGAVAGAAVWLSFLLAGVVASLQGYSFAKFGGRYPTAGGLLEYVRRGYGDGHFTGIIAWLILATNAIVTAMVAISFGSYASAALTDGNDTWVKAFAVLLVVAMASLNVLGSQAVARVQTVVVVVVIGILIVFAISTLANLTPGHLDPSTYPPVKNIISSVALTFFAFLGFGVITFTAKDLAKPSRQLPQAMFLALGIAMVIYIAVSLGVFGTLTVKQVIDSGGTALAVAAQPTLGRAGYWLMTVTALLCYIGRNQCRVVSRHWTLREHGYDRPVSPVVESEAWQPSTNWSTPDGGDRHCTSSRLQPRCGGLDRERCGPHGVRPHRGRAFPGSTRDRRAGLVVDLGRRQRSRRACNVHFHHLGPRAGEDSDDSRHLGRERRYRPAVEAATRRQRPFSNARRPAGCTWLRGGTPHCARHPQAETHSRKSHSRGWR